MRPYLSAKFLRVGNHLINLELIQQVELRKDNSAIITVPGPRKSFRMIEVPDPAGRQLWDFFSENLVVIDFDQESTQPTEIKQKSKAPGKEKASPNPKASSKKKEAAKGKAADPLTPLVVAPVSLDVKPKAEPKKSAKKSSRKP